MGAPVNFKDLIKAAGDAGFSLLPLGTYDAKVYATENKKTAKGKDMITVKYEITSGPHGGRKLSNNMVLSPESAIALGFFFREMRAMGLSAEYFQANPSMEKVAADLIGKTCRIEVGTEVYRDEDRNIVKKITAPAFGVMSAAAPAAMPQPSPQPVSVKVPASTADQVADPSAPKLPY